MWDLGEPEPSCGTAGVCKSHCNGGVRWLWVTVLRCCARGKCMHRGANRIVMVMVVSRWLWVVGLRRCVRGKCTHRIANRIVMVVQGGFALMVGSRWLWVAGLRCCARGKCMHIGAHWIVRGVSRWLWVVGSSPRRMWVYTGAFYHRKVGFERLRAKSCVLQ